MGEIYLQMALWLLAQLGWKLPLLLSANQGTRTTSNTLSQTIDQLVSTDTKCPFKKCDKFLFCRLFARRKILHIQTPTERELRCMKLRIILFATFLNYLGRSKIIFKVLLNLFSKQNELSYVPWCCCHIFRFAVSVLQLSLLIDSLAVLIALHKISLHC